MRLIVLAVYSTALLVTACASAEVRAEPGEGESHPALTGSLQTPQATAPSKIVIDASIPETFLPTPDETAPLSSDAVFAGYAKHNGSARTSPPEGVTVLLGRLTLPLGRGRPGEYTAHNELVWAFTWHQCIAAGIPPPPGSSAPEPPTAPTSCTAWLFLDATSGRMVEQTWQS